MAKAKLVVGDQSSAEFDELRRTVNTLLLILENAKASITAGASAEDVLGALSDAIETGVDNNPNTVANVVSTDLEVAGLIPSPRHPNRPGSKKGTQLTDLDPSNV